MKFADNFYIIFVQEELNPWLDITDLGTLWIFVLLQYGGGGQNIAALDGRP